MKKAAQISMIQEYHSLKSFKLSIKNVFWLLEAILLSDQKMTVETTTEVISTQQNQNKLKPSLSQDTLNVYKHKVKFTLDDRVV